MPSIVAVSNGLIPSIVAAAMSHAGLSHLKRLTRIAHAGPGQIQFFESGEFRAVSESGIRNRCTVEVQANELLEGCHVSESRVVEPRVTRDQRLQLDQRLQMSQPCRGRSGRQRQ